MDDLTPYDPIYDRKDTLLLTNLTAEQYKSRQRRDQLPDAYFTTEQIRAADASAEMDEVSGRSKMSFWQVVGIEMQNILIAKEGMSVDRAHQIINNIDHDMLRDYTSDVVPRAFTGDLWLVQGTYHDASTDTLLLCGRAIHQSLDDAKATIMRDTIAEELPARIEAVNIHAAIHTVINRAVRHGLPLPRLNGQE